MGASRIPHRYCVPHLHPGQRHRPARRNYYPQQRRICQLKHLYPTAGSVPNLSEIIAASGYIPALAHRGLALRRPTFHTHGVIRCIQPGALAGATRHDRSSFPLVIQAVAVKTDQQTARLLRAFTHYGTNAFLPIRPDDSALFLRIRSPRR